MHLKSLTLKGFKSFADRTPLRMERGVTVVVGPNGSGKSNITDAVLWVLGEQSAKTLRGNAMEDVIFAGSSARQAVGVAEVDLTLDNTDGALPLEFSEITITRRMYRSGDSEYLINGSPCRLMDVHDLLHDSGLGRDTHSIISQGRLDEILNSRPEDRRTLIEEAAGVLKHKKRKERALRKLTGMDANLARARDVLGEVDRQLRPLQRQADRAREHESVAAELRDLEVAVAVADLRELQVGWESMLKREKEQDADIELARYRLTEKERELGSFQSLLEEKGLFVGDLSEQRRRLQAVLERLNSGLLLLEEKGKNLVERLSELRGKVHQSEGRRARRQDEVAQLTAQRTDSDAEMKALYTQLGELRREAEAARKDRQAADDALTAVNSGARRARKEADDARGDTASLDQALAAFKLEEELLSERADALKVQRSSLMDTLSTRRGRLEQLDQSRARSGKELKFADADVEKRVRFLESKRKALDETRETLTAARSEVRGLEEVDRAFQTATPALAWVLSSEQRLPGLVGPVTETITVDPKLEKVVEQALGSDLFCVLVRDRGSANALLRHLGTHGAGDISVLALDAAVPATAEGPRHGRRLADAVQCRDDIRPAIESLIGDVWLVPTLAEALDAAARRPGVRYVSEDGHMVWPSGKITVGPAVDASSTVLARKRRINELKDDEQAALMRTGDAEAAVAEAEEALAAAQQDALELGQRIAAMAGEHESLVEDVGRIEQGLTDLDAEQDRVAARRAAIVERAAKDGPARETLAGRIAELDAEWARLDEEAAVRAEERDNRFREEAALATRLGQCQVDIATVSEREVYMKRQLSAAMTELAEIDDALSASVQTEAALELLRERIQPVHDLYAALLDRAESWAVKLRDRARFEQADSESLRDTIHAAQEAVREAQAALEERTSAMSDIRVEKGQLQIQVDSSVQRIVEDYDMPIERALGLPGIGDRDKTADRVTRLKRQLANMGPVNEIAVEEYRAMNERRSFMAAQIDDLSSSRTALQKVVRAIDRKMRDLFLETFEQVNAHFQDVFALLFPGGHAELRMTDPDDPEQTGVEVIAQPLGKKLQKMTLMSGGEKSLTAIALLFALYHTRPCPFYILDEVEAALDDSNLRRFVSFVDSLRRHTQFIVVTHQRRTMEMADVLYGVSMQSDGVSKVVSQRLDRSGSPHEAPA
ncbi:MAG TPA: chromosome segregation protein SMC [Coriobacteriia bacterium]